MALLALSWPGTVLSAGWATGSGMLGGQSVAAQGAALPAGLGQASVPAAARPWGQEAKLTANDGTAYDSFGTSVAIEGATALIGAYGRNNRTGAAYVFVRSGTAWTQQAKLTADDGAANDSFGIRVAIEGATALIGASGKNGFRGAAYVFERHGTAWTQQSELTASNGASNDGFGASVSLSGATALVGAFGKNGNRGAAYVFERRGTTWIQQAELTASDRAAGDYFGNSVSLSATTALVGANDKDGATGAAYVFERRSTTWVQQTKLSASDGATSDEFGFSVALSGGTALVGAFARNSFKGAAYIFVRKGTTWTQQTELAASDSAANDYFGSSVAIAGPAALVGANGKNGATGAAYIFVRKGTTWTQQTKLVAGDGTFGDNFGAATALAGNTILVGVAIKTRSTGAAYLFVRSGNQAPRIDKQIALAPTGFSATVEALRPTPRPSFWRIRTRIDNLVPSARLCSPAASL